MLRLLYLLCFLLSLIQSQAQFSMLDSIKLATKSKPRLFVGFHNRNTFIKANTVKLYGLVAGVDYDEKAKFFIGFYGLSDADSRLLLNDNRFTDDSVYRSLNINNLSLGMEYSLYQKNRLNIMWPIQIGIGSAVTNYKSSDSLLLQDAFSIFPLESGVNAYYKIIDWMILKSGVGYRLSLGNAEAIKLSSPYYNIGIAIRLGELCRDIKSLTD